MKSDPNSALVFFELVKRLCPEYVDLITAQDDRQFESAFDLFLERAVSNLECNKRDFAELDEEALTGILVGELNGVPGLEVSKEKYSNGHVDLTIETPDCRPARKKLGEAKIYAGRAWHFKGLEQLVGRYSTGRESRGLLIVYVRREGIADLFAKLRQAMDDAQPQKQKGLTTQHSLKWAFVSTHRHSSGEHLEVSHVGCNLYVD